MEPDRDERSWEDKPRRMLLIWQAIAAAGIATHADIKQALKRDGVEEWLTPTKLSRDLKALEDLDMVVRVGEGRRSRFMVHPDLPGLFIGAEVLSDHARGLKPDDLADFAELGVFRSESRPWQGYLAAAIAELAAASPPASTGARLVQRLATLWEARTGRSLQLAPKVETRSLQPSFERSRLAITTDSWQAVWTALEGERQLRVWLATDGREKAGRVVSPRKLLWFNGRPRLEVVERHGNRRLLRLMPLHDVKRLEVLDTSIEPRDRPSQAETSLQERTWGLDLHERNHDQTDREVDVLVRFSGSAISPIQADPGCAQAQLEKARFNGRPVLHYRVRTIPGPYFRRWIRMWGAEAEVLAPPELVAEFRQDAIAMASNYGVRPE